MTVIKVVDEIMGSGKSTWIMGEIRKWLEDQTFDQVVYVSPLLSEVGGERDGNKWRKGRIQSVLPEHNFMFPIPTGGSKLNDIKRLVGSGCNIATTHSLLAYLDDDCISLIAENRNVLVIDEAVGAYERYEGLSAEVIKVLISGGQLLVGDKNKVEWNHIVYPIIPEEFRELVDLCDSGCAMLLGDSVLIWEFSPRVLDAFDEVWILTYLFEGSVMNSWCKINSIGVERVRPLLHRSTQEVKERLSHLIELVEPPSIDSLDKYSLSHVWWNSASQEQLTDVKGFLSNTIKNYLNPHGVKVKDILVTCPKDRWYKPENGQRGKLLVRGTRYASGEWLASSCRATNDYADKKAILYLLNKHPNLSVSMYCKQEGFPIDQDLYALGEMLQFVFRGCVRKGEKMYLIMPSKRMREIYKKWVGGYFDAEEKEEAP